jgi:hypothetical protein
MKREQLEGFSPIVRTKINSKMVTVVTKLNVFNGSEKPISGRIQFKSKPINITKARLRPTEKRIM